MARVFYGWRIVGVAFLTHCVTVGIVFYSFGVFLPELIADCGWTRAETSFGFSLVALCGAVYSPIIGRVIDRFGPRPSQLIGAVIMALGFVLLSRVRTLPAFYVTLGLVVALGSTALGMLPSNAAVARWFIRRRGQALGVSTAGISMGGVIFVPLTQALIERYGWRSTCLWLAALIVVLVIPPVAAFMRSSPESMNLLPDGGRPAAPGEPIDFDAEVERSWTVREAVRHRNFWLIVLAFALTVTGISATLLHQISFLADRGFPAHRAAWVLGSTAGVGVLGKLGFGSLLDRFGHRRVVMACFVLQGIGITFLILPLHTWTLVLYVVVYGFAMGGNATLQATMLAECFGRLHYGAIAGRMAPFIVVAQALAIPAAGFVRDATGTYVPAFVAVSVASLAAAACIRYVRIDATPAL